MTAILTPEARQVIKDLDHALKKAMKNATCLYPGCSNPPIGSHVIARKTLKLIAEESHVLTWPPARNLSSWEMAHTINAGKPLEQMHKEPLLVGIGDKNKITDPLFCNTHDEKIFAPLEKQAFSFLPEQVVLLAYRALCSMTFSKPPTDAILEVARMHGYSHSLDTPEHLQRLERFFASKSVLSIRQSYMRIHQTQDYGQLGWAMYLVNVPPCIAATHSLIPVNDNDALAIINGTQTVTENDFISFSFLPYPPLNNSICVISWLRGSQGAQRFMALNRINELSEKDQQDLFLFFAFESPTIYISPIWWKTLSEAKREEYKQIHLNVGREHAELV